MQQDDPKQMADQAWSLFEAGRLDEAKALFASICAIDPSDEESWMMLGSLHGQAGHLSDAVACLKKAVALSPDYAEAHLNLGRILLAQGEPAGAERACRQALRSQPDLQGALVHLAVALKAQQKFAEAAACYEQLLRANPGEVWLHVDLGSVYLDSLNLPKAVECYRTALRLKPGDRVISYMLAMAQGQTAPAASPPEYVVNLFDQYAGSFDQHLVEELEYRSPEFLHRLVTSLIGQPAARLDVLDLGCGTGLCGVRFRELARRQIGVDLSGKMLAKARELGVYDELLHADVTEFLQTQSGAYDLVLAADVFVYIGDLTEVFGACRTALRTGGLFAFSFEAAAADATYALRKSGRYAQSLGYVKELAQKIGFEEAGIEQVILRKDRGEPIAGYIMALRRPLAG